MFGAALAGVLIAAFGVSAALLVDAASFALIAVVLVVARDLPEPEHEDRTPWRERFVDGLEFVRDIRPVRTLLIGQSLALICFTLVVPIEVIYAKESLGTTTPASGSCCPPGARASCSAACCSCCSRSAPGSLIILVSSAAVGFAYLGMSQAGTLAVACAFSVLGGAGNGVQWVAVMTALQEATPPEFQARMAGLLESLGAAMPGVGLPARRHDRRARLPAHRLRGRGRGNPRAGGGRPRSCAPGRVRPRRRPASTIGRRLSRS